MRTQILPLSILGSVSLAFLLGCGGSSGNNNTDQQTLPQAPSLEFANLTAADFSLDDSNSAVKLPPSGVTQFWEVRYVYNSGDDSDEVVSRRKVWGTENVTVEGVTFEAITATVSRLQGSTWEVVENHIEGYTILHDWVWRYTDKYSDNGELVSVLYPVAPTQLNNDSQFETTDRWTVFRHHRVQTGVQSPAPREEDNSIRVDFTFRESNGEVYTGDGHQYFGSEGLIYFYQRDDDQDGETEIRKLLNEEPTPNIKSSEAIPAYAF
ncbi:MAG: hypothetical protein EA402_04555 [Planctomycetota bacterium]|nr:MAG: hypothetical protein EA402_04555 [Planctomycetota bacterium]